MPIRTLITSDRAIWNPLWQAYLAFYKTSLPVEVYDRTFARLTSGTGVMGGFIAEDEAGVPAGIVHWIKHPTCWSISEIVYLQDLFVKPDFRGGRYGRALIEAVYKKAEQMGNSRVYWLTEETNLTAQLLYNRVAERTGFIVYRKTIG